MQNFNNFLMQTLLWLDKSINQVKEKVHINFNHSYIFIHEENKLWIKVIESFKKKLCCFKDEYIRLGLRNARGSMKGS